MGLFTKCDFKPQPLFSTIKERVFCAIFLLLVLALNLGYKYYELVELKAAKTPQITAFVLLTYPKIKNNKSYFVLKLKSDYGIFYTTSHEDLKPLAGRFVRANFIFSKVSFLEYLRGFYAPHFNLKLLRERDFRDPLREFVKIQHLSENETFKIVKSSEIIKSEIEFGADIESGVNLDSIKSIESSKNIESGASIESKNTAPRGDSIESMDSIKAKNTADSIKNPQFTQFTHFSWLLQEMPKIYTPREFVYQNKNLDFIESNLNTESSANIESKNAAPREDSIDSIESSVNIESKSAANSIKSPQNAELSNLLSNMYLALFIADPLPLAWREFAQNYGISHIFAISGFHLGILASAMGFLFSLFYSPLHQRFFPWRERFSDIALICCVSLAGYYFLLLNSPSFLRALSMALFAAFLAWRGVAILKVESLFWCAAILLALFPQLSFSLGFYFSCFGVLFLFLFMRYFSFGVGFVQRCVWVLGLNFCVFFAMFIISHYFFGVFSPKSLLAPIFTLGFVVFYPFSIIAHLLGFGGLLDNALLLLLAQNFSAIQIVPRFWLFVLCNILAILGIWRKWAFIALLAINLAFYGFCLCVFVIL